jgi:hypothetical protein
MATRSASTPSFRKSISFTESHVVALHSGMKIPMQKSKMMKHFPGLFIGFIEL